MDWWWSLGRQFFGVLVLEEGFSGRVQFSPISSISWCLVSRTILVIPGSAENDSCQEFCDIDLGLRVLLGKADCCGDDD